jgi:hypothetical protein
MGEEAAPTYAAEWAEDFLGLGFSLDEFDP